MRTAILFAALLIVAPAAAEIADADLEAAYKVCMAHFHPAPPHATTPRGDIWDAGFESCATIRDEWDKRGLAAAQKAAGEKSAIDAIAKGIGK